MKGRRIILSLGIIGLLITGCNTHTRPPKVIGQSKNDEKQMMMVAKAAQKTGQYKTAIKIYSQVVKFHPKDLDPALQLANSLKASGDYQQAVNSYQKALKIKPDNAVIMRDLATSYMGANQPQKALDFYAKALAKNNKDFQVYNDLGVLLEISGNNYWASQCYQRGLKLNPDDAGLNTNYGLSLALVENYKLALKYLARADDATKKSQRYKGNYLAVKAIVKELKHKKGAEKAYDIKDLHQLLVKNVVPPNYPKLATKQAMTVASKYCS